MGTFEQDKKESAVNIVPFAVIAFVYFTERQLY